MDKTPTPTKLLQSIEEIGLFVDDDDIDVGVAKDRQKTVDALKDRLVENPFDEHFRKATQMQKEAASIYSANGDNEKQVKIWLSKRLWKIRALIKINMKPERIIDEACACWRPGFDSPVFQIFFHFDVRW